MQIVLALSVIFLHGQLSLAGGKHRSCCLPDRLEGEAFQLETQTRFVFAVDYKAGRLYRTSDRVTPDWFNIIDYIGKQIYTSHDGNCSITDYPEASQKVQCLTTDQRIGSNRFGDHLNAMHLETYSYEETPGTRIVKTVIRQGELCLPTTTSLTSWREGEQNITLIYSNITPYITSNLIYSSFHGCTKVDEVTPAYRKRETTGVQDKYFMHY